MIALAPPEERRPLTIFVPHASDLLTDNRAHGDGLVAFEVVWRLAERGHRLHVAAPAIDVRRSLPPNLHLYEIDSPPSPMIPRRLAYMFAVRRLYARIHRSDPIDVAHQLNPVFTGISLALRGMKAPRVLGSFVGDWPSETGPERTPIAAVRRKIAALQQFDAAALLVTTPAARERIVERERNAAKIFTIPHGIDASRFMAANGTAHAEAQPATVLFLGGLERRKGIFVLIDAFKLIHAVHPTAVLAIAGHGTEWRGVMDAVTQAGLTECVRFLGPVAREGVPKVLADSTVVCVPSYGEPFGMVLLEAMASAKPVVATDLGGARHIINSQGGRRVPPAAPAALADALLEILRSPALAARMGLYNRRLAVECYGWESIIDRLESVYFEVIEKQRK